MFALVGLSGSAKLLEGIGLGHLVSHHGFLLAGQFLHLRLDLAEVALLDALAAGQEHVVEESVLDGWSESELDAGIEFLQRLGEQVCRCVPEGVTAFLIVPLVEGDAGVLVDGSV